MGMYYWPGKTWDESKDWRIQPGMEMTHHQAMLRESDGLWVCSRCGLVNPSDDQPCIPVNIEPSAEMAARSTESER